MRFILILGALCVIALCFGIYHTTSKEPIAFGVFLREHAITKEPEEQIESAYTRVRFVGDVMLARNVENLMNIYGPTYPYAKLDPHPDDAYLVGNFEASIPTTHVHTPSMQFQFSVKQEHIPALGEYGFTHMGLANNHAYDHGTAGLRNSYTVLAENDLNPFGDPAVHASSSPTYLTVGTRVVALIPVYAVTTTLTQAQIDALFSEAVTSSDMQIVYVHWGTEYEAMHSRFQEELAQRLIDAGADAVIGHHPHVVQDIALYKNVPIFYSLGNFIFDQYFSTAVQEGLMVELSWGEDGSTSFDLIPLSSIGSRSAPYMMGEFERGIMLDTLADNSEAGLEEMIRSGRITLSP